MADKLFAVGDRVTVTTQPPYLKTADPMPMLRPPDLITVGEEGTVLEQKLGIGRSEEHTSELQSLTNLVCRLLLEKKNNFSLVVSHVLSLMP